MKIIYFFLYLWVIFALLDPDSEFETLATAHNQIAVTFTIVYWYNIEYIYKVINARYIYRYCTSSCVASSISTLYGGAKMSRNAA
jgi:hypothetical protein